jgi:hypothetical protein
LTVQACIVWDCDRDTYDGAIGTHHLHGE